MTAADEGVQQVELKLIGYALSLVLSGNSGVRAFLPSFILSAVAWARPDLIQLDENMEWMRHPVTFGISGFLALTETVAEFIPGIDHIYHTIMTFIHPFMGLVMSVAPNLGTAEVSRFTQSPMAIFGGTNALCLHLLKMVLRLAGVGWLNQIIAFIEEAVVVIIVPLVLFFETCAFIGAVLVVIALMRYIYHKTGCDGSEPSRPTLGPKTENYIKRNHSIISLFTLKHDGFGLGRVTRSALLLAVVIFQLGIVVSLVDKPMMPIIRTVVTALCVIPYRFAARLIIKKAYRMDRKQFKLNFAAQNPTMKTSYLKSFLSHVPIVKSHVASPDKALPDMTVEDSKRTLTVSFLILGISIFYAVHELVQLKRGEGAHVTMDYFTSLFYSLIVFETLELIMIYWFFGRCCPCLFDAADFDKGTSEEEEGKGNSSEKKANKGKESKVELQVVSSSPPMTRE